MRRHSRLVDDYSPKQRYDPSLLTQNEFLWHGLYPNSKHSSMSRHPYSSSQMYPSLHTSHPFGPLNRQWFKHDVSHTAHCIVDFSKYIPIEQASVSLELDSHDASWINGNMKGKSVKRNILQPPSLINLFLSTTGLRTRVNHRTFNDRPIERDWRHLRHLMDLLWGKSTNRALAIVHTTPHL